MTQSEFDLLYKRRRDAIETALCAWLPTVDDDSQTTADAMRYAVSAGGKRIRPIIMLEFYSLSGRDESRIMPFAAALEMIHSYSLVHDDMPCMDNSDLRRGMPSVHKRFGQWQALLAGDGLLNYAFETVCAHTDTQILDSKTVLACIKELAAASGIYGMVGGQSLDLSSEGRELDITALTALQSKKTGALIRAAGRVGTIAAQLDCKAVELATEYCENLGLAFQITDDILDYCGSEEKLGKPVGGDAEANKSTFVTIAGLEEAKRRADALTERCVETANRLGSDFLGILASRMLTRNN